MEALLALELDNVDARPGAETERHRAAYAHRHVEHGAVLGVFAAPFVVGPLGRRHTAQADLSGVGMARERQRDVGLVEHAAPPMARVVAQQNLERPLGGALERLRQVAIVGEGRPTDVLHADELDGGAVATDAYVLVEEQPPSYFLLQVFQHRLVFPDVAQALVLAILAIVVVSHHREHAVARLYLLQRVLERYHLVGADVHQVACEHHQIGPLLVDQPHQLIDKRAVAQERTDVDIRQLHYAVAIKLLREEWRLAGGRAHYEMAPTKEEAVDHQQNPSHGERHGPAAARQRPR